uniref:Uncharacterized protein n=1 Tax=Utricularia reniformis TaxID=192314 RepID=A0A1Y0AYV3_9LAMI|nr:hypothetical protein AEK19_MT0898 [Utricularia reniformis]ART30327.1 hypothetical protein AEK19_MT0898 [Utricularia reniformis]
MGLLVEQPHSKTLTEVLFSTRFSIHFILATSMELVQYTRYTTQLHRSFRWVDSITFGGRKESIYLYQY